MEALAVVLPAESPSTIAQLATLTITKSGWLTNVADNVIASIKRDFPKLVSRDCRIANFDCMAYRPADVDSQRRRRESELVFLPFRRKSFERYPSLYSMSSSTSPGFLFNCRADLESLYLDGQILFWYGVESSDEVKLLMQEFARHGREMFGDTNLESKLHRAAGASMPIDISIPTALSGSMQQARAYSTKTAPLCSISSSRRVQSRRYRCFRHSARSYATTTNPNPPLGSKNSTNSKPSKVALIGARGYTGQALISLLNGHKNIDLQQ